MAITTTTKTRKLTEIQALTYAVALSKSESIELPENVTMDDLADKLTHMLNAKVKIAGDAKNSKKTNPRMNECAEYLVSHMNQGELYDIEYLRHMIPSGLIYKHGLAMDEGGIVSSQQTAAIMRNAIERGLVKREMLSKTQAAYSLA